MLFFVLLELLTLAILALQTNAFFQVAGPGLKESAARPAADNGVVWVCCSRRRLSC